MDGDHSTPAAHKCDAISARATLDYTHGCYTKYRARWKSSECFYCTYQRRRRTGYPTNGESNLHLKWSLVD